MELKGFELRETHACFRPAGLANREGFLHVLTEVMKACRESNVTRLLIDATMLSHEPITTVDQFQFASGLATFWDRGIRLAMVGRADQMDPDQFAVLVAKNRGLYIGIYRTETEALSWLLEGQPGWTHPTK